MDRHGNRLACVQRRCNLPLLQLSGPPIGPAKVQSLLKPNGIYFILANWPDAERLRWAASRSASRTPSPLTGSSLDSGYTAEEKEWLKRNWGGEFRFLTSHGLSIYDEDDREEGRRIVRAIMEKDDDEERGNGHGYVQIAGERGGFLL
ncbi:hypothetical protein N656DRAFT_773078 [Canariomyces notabilis]|uniref:Uncharacterized protein n=1 Tax=Canariomyces notabilis TaxID=2074819 RepID=A0AAN6YY53_9PEZI|nr:hypothetical protein N656DRAFT_773078 [Canariomyces arenarius]